MTMEPASIGAPMSWMVVNWADEVQVRAVRSIPTSILTQALHVYFYLSDNQPIFVCAGRKNTAREHQRGLTFCLDCHEAPRQPIKSQ